MNDTKKRIAKLVSFGAGGDTVHYGKNHTCTGHGTPERPHAADLSKGEILDGCPVIDKREAVETPRGYAWVFAGPMVNVDLPAGSVDRLGPVCPIMAQAMGENPYGGMIAMHEATRTETRPGALDTVSTEEYIAGWREAGARIGRYEGGVIVWE